MLIIYYYWMKGKCSMYKFTLVHRGDHNSALICKKIKETLIKHKFEYTDIDPNLVIYVGGDGTLLKAFHKWLDRIDQVAFTGIHTGTLGFSTDYTVDEVEIFLNDLINKKPLYEEKRILQANCHTNGSFKTYYALNEIRVENIVKTQVMDVLLDNEYFERFRGNGLCISGQYGSTAYNRSIGGAVMFPGLDLLQMTEISGIHHRHAKSLGAPLILAPETSIVLKSETFEHALLCYDHLHIHMDKINFVEISSYKKTMKFAHFNKISHIERLHSLF